MRQDLFIASLEIGKDEEPDWDAARRALATLSPRRVKQLYVTEEYDKNPTPEALAAFRERIAGGLRALQDCWDGSNDSNIHDLRNSQVLLFGGVSNGDEPCEHWADAHLAIAAGLATAAGFWSRPIRERRARRPPPRSISLARLRAILERESACIAPEDVGPLMQVIRREAAR